MAVLLAHVSAVPYFRSESVQCTLYILILIQLSEDTKPIDSAGRCIIVTEISSDLIVAV
jgi:hypothetical protein